MTSFTEYEEILEAAKSRKIGNLAGIVNSRMDGLQPSSCRPYLGALIIFQTPSSYDQLGDLNKIIKVDPSNATIRLR